MKMIYNDSRQNVLPSYYMAIQRAGKDNSPKNITITENKAPTDESIRLYREMLEKARNDVVDAFVVKNTLYEAYVEVAYDVIHMSYLLYFKFKLNGVEFKSKSKITEYSIEDRNKIGEIIYKKFVEEVSALLLDEIAKSQESRQVFYRS